MSVRTVVERGPKGKKVVAYALDWPGWSRGAKTADNALATLAAYRDRYRPVAVIAGLGGEFDAAGDFEVVEDRIGTGSTDFWGISFSPSSFEIGAMPTEEFERKLILLQACWAHFDHVVARVSPEMRKGPRGGGRDRDEIMNHTLGNERLQLAVKVGVTTPEGAQLTPEGRRTHREDYVAALREHNAAGKKARTWELAFLLRHTAFHLMDHAWEMEDKDLSPIATPGESANH